MGDTGQIEKKALPKRSTRGKRMKAQLAEEEEQADAEFWNQEFFAEDARDEDYASEKEEEDVPDSDFFESESEEDDEEVEVRKEPKKKALKAPGAPPVRPKAAKPPKSSVKKSEAGSPSVLAAQQAAAAASGEVSQQLLFEVTYEAPTLRKSTRERMEVAQKERQERDQIAKATRRPTQKSEYRVLTQEELLAEAARTELENLASLRVLLAQEEETKRKANIKKQRYGGPMVKQRSRGVEALLPPEPSAVVSFEQQLAAAGTAAAAAAAAVSSMLGTPGAFGTGAPLLPGAAVAMDIDTAGQQQGAPAAAAAAGAASAAGATAVSDGSVVASASAVKTEASQVAAETSVQAPADGAAATAAVPNSAAVAAPAGTVTIDVAREQPAATPEAAATSLEVQQQQQQQPSGPTLIKQEITTLQCVGMKAPKWLQPQRVRPPPAKPLCAITGLVAKYKDPLTGHYYASAEAFRELRRRLGQPLPDSHKRRKSADAPAAAGVSLGLLGPGQQGGASAVAAAAAGGFPPGEGQLLSLLQQHVQHQQALLANGKGRGGKAAYQPQPGVPGEVMALVLNVSQLVHGSS